MNFKKLTKQEISDIIERCHFTIKERRFFDLRCDGYTLEEITMEMKFSESTADRLSKEIKSKIYQSQN